MIQRASVNNVRFAAAILALLAGNAVLAQGAQVPMSGSSSTSTTTLPKEQLSQEDLSQRSDTELTELTAQWGQLSPEQRRRLLAEVRGRMVNNRQAQRPQGLVVQRRYGRVVRKSDGSVVLQTRVVQIRPRNDARPGSKPNNGDTSAPRVTFGIGFEQRTRGPAQIRISEQPAQVAENTRPSGAPLESAPLEIEQSTVVISQESPLSSNR